MAGVLVVRKTILCSLVLVMMSASAGPVPGHTVAVTPVYGAGYVAGALHYDCAQLAPVTTAIEQVGEEYLLSVHIPGACTPESRNDCVGHYYPEADVVFGPCGGDHVEAWFWAWDVQLGAKPSYELAMVGLSYWLDPCTPAIYGPGGLAVGPEEVPDSHDIPAELERSGCFAAASFYGFRSQFPSVPDSPVETPQLPADVEKPDAAESVTRVLEMT